MIDIRGVKAKAETAQSAKRQGEGYGIVTIGAGKPWRKSWRILMDAVSPQTDERLAELKPRLDRAIQDFQVRDAKLKRDPRGFGNDPGMLNLYRDADFARAAEALIVGFRQGHLTISPYRWGHIGQKIDRLLENVGQYQPK